MLFGLVMGVLLSITTVLGPAFNEEAKFGEALLTAAPLFIYSVCLLVLVIKIETICELLRLEREVQHMKEERQRVEVVQNEMHGFWDNVQELTDIWLYRTIPRLDLYKEVNHHLGDAEPAALAMQLKKANDRIEHLNKNVGSLQDWRQRFAAGDA